MLKVIIDNRTNYKSKFIRVIAKTVNQCSMYSPASTTILCIVILWLVLVPCLNQWPRMLNNLTLYAVSPVLPNIG